MYLAFNQKNGDRYPSDPPVIMSEYQQPTNILMALSDRDVGQLTQYIRLRHLMTWYPAFDRNKSRFESERRHHHNNSDSGVMATYESHKLGISLRRLRRYQIMPAKY